MDVLDLVQWPAMVLTVVSAYLVASRSPRKRKIGFWCYIVTNILWTMWGVHDHAYALIGLQVFLAGMNIRGITKNEQMESASSS